MAPVPRSEAIDRSPRPPTTGRVLVLDGRTRQSLSVTRALGRRGLIVDVGEWLRVTLAMSSKYCRRRVVYPNPESRPDAFIAFLERTLEAGGYDLVIPNSDTTVKLIATHRDALGVHASIPLPRIDVVARILDKGELIRHATAIGIPCPTTHFFEDPAEVRASSTTFDYPMVIKPRISGGALGLRIVDTPDELNRQYLAVSSTFPRPLVQEYIPDGGGKFTYGGIIGANGKDKASFVHEYLRLYPPTAGVGTYARSARHEAVRGLGSHLLTSLHYRGVAEVEFKVDPRDGTPKLLEINPRFWGMTEVAVRAGMDLPFHLYSSFVEGNHEFAGDYDTDIFVRWMLPGEILHLIANWRNIDNKVAFLRSNEPNTHFYVISRDDPRPALMTPITAVYSLLNRQTRELVFRHR